MSFATAVRDILWKRREPSFYSLLNLLTIENGLLIGTDLQMTQVFRLTCPDATFFSEADANQHAVGLGRLLDSLPPNATAQLLIRVRWDGARKLDEFQAVQRPADEMTQFILKERIDFLRAQPFRRVEHYLAITTHPAPVDFSWFRMGLFSIKPPQPSEALAAQHARRVQELETIGTNVVATLRDAKVAAQALSEEELVEYLYERLNPGTATHTTPPSNPLGLSLRNRLALNACQQDFDRATIDGYHHRSLNLQVRPTTINAAAMHNLINQIPGDFDFSVAVHSLLQETAEKSIKATAATTFTLSQIHLTRYHEAELLTQDADEMAAHAKANFQQLYLASMHVVLRDVDPHKLTDHHVKTIQAFRRLDDAVPIIEDDNHLGQFLASMPNHSHLNQRTHAMPTDVAARFLTISSSWDGAANPQILLPTDDEKLIGVDLFDPKELTAKHALILGVSGEGKSVLTNTLLESFHTASEDHHVVVIDDGGSYRRICETLNGQYLEPTLDGDYSFNPLLAKSYAVDAEGQLDSDFLSFVITLVQMMVGRGKLEPAEKTVIEKCLIATYREAKTDTPLLGDLRTAFGQYKGGKVDSECADFFHRNLELWTSGNYGRLLNRPSSFDAKARFIVFDLNKMTQEDLKPVVLLIIRSVIHPKLANKALKKIIALDEVWKFLREKAGSDLVSEWYKTGRRFNTSVWVITQSADDLLSSAAATAIGENATVKWILNLGGGYDKLRQLKLTDEAIEVVKGLGKNPERSKYRKVYLQLGERKIVIRNMLSKVAYFRYTTDPQDLRCEVALRKKEPTWKMMQVLAALGRLKELNPAFSADQLHVEISEGRYSRAN